MESALNGADAEVVFEIRNDPSKPESFSIQKTGGDQIRIVGTDAAGAMYGGLEVAEELRIGGLKAVTADEQKPAMDMRGIKFNIPLDVRTPSYSDMGDAGQYNIPHMWDFGFWREFIDEAASHRYNYISLWNLHPFPSMVKLPDYPDVALNDVKRAVNLEKKFYNGRGQDYDLPEILDETETLLTMTIDEKIAFWRKVMRHGKERNVDFYIVTWNIFDYGTGGKYGIDDSEKNPVSIDYFRKCVKQLFLTYPDLKGIGITTGENMDDLSTQEMEDWSFKTYGQGVLDVVQEQPERKITFLHRKLDPSDARVIADTFKPLVDHPNVDFIFSYKYAKAHAYSATKQPFYERLAKEIEGRGDLKTIWTMRNDSTYLFRWAAPAWMREFVRNLPMEITRGHYFGSDGWIWGRDFISKGGAGPGELEIKKHWFQWMLWGRLAYNPKISDERFTGIAQARFPAVDAGKLMTAWQAASMTYPLATGFHYGSLDYHWYPEAAIGVKGNKKNKFHDVDSFITLKPHPGSGYIGIQDFVKMIRDGKPFTGTGPFEVSSQLLDNADKALSIVQDLNAGADTELAETLEDIQAMALLGRYYGHKIAGATRLHLYREGGRGG
ncbi:MAG: carbohydrate-binding family 6 protein [Bdellovibrionaceae bacterium]|nr:carbohydrate-binding family 6 protein [Pseudobdellovibrionaceae bacterium]